MYCYWMSLKRCSSKHDDLVSAEKSKVTGVNIYLALLLPPLLLLQPLDEGGGVGGRARLRPRDLDLGLECVSGMDTHIDF